MRFAGDIDYPVESNADIEAAIADFKAKVIEAIPTQGEEAWSLKLMFDAETRPQADFKAFR